MSDSLVIDQVSIAYGDHVAVKDVSLTIAPGEVHVLLGHSGSGKTTILRAVAGFERLRSGVIRVGGREVDGTQFVPPEKRPVGLVFQEYALFPHMTVGKNVGFGLPSGSSAEVQRLLTLIGLEHRIDAMPGELSGGEQQRVALARALGRKPDLLLLDEPFSNLDPELRKDIRAQTFELVRNEGFSTMLVTHSAVEAMDVADRISVIKNGCLLQSGTPRELYDTPNSYQVARALGTANILPATCTDGIVSCALGEVEFVTGNPVSGRGQIVFRPEHVEIGIEGVAVHVDSSRFMGSHFDYRIDIGGTKIDAACAAEIADVRASLTRAHWLNEPGD